MGDTKQTKTKQQKDTKVQQRQRNAPVHKKTQKKIERIEVDNKGKAKKVKR